MGENKKKTVLIILVIVICLGFVIMFVKSKNGVFFELKDKFVDLTKGEEGKVTTISETSLKEVFEISELQTASYFYNDVVPVYEEDNETLKYYVAYEGTVTAGIDFDDIDFDSKDDGMTIIIQLPDVTIQDTSVEFGTMEYIFEDDKYDTQDTPKEAYAICEKDLQEKVESDDKFLDTARNNVISVIEALVVPWVEQINGEYSVIIE